MSDTHRLFVYCDDESTRTQAHRGRVAKVVQFERDHPAELAREWEIPEDAVDPADLWMIREVDTRRNLRLANEVLRTSPPGEVGLAGHFEAHARVRFDPRPEVERQVNRDGSLRENNNDPRADHKTYVMRCKLCGLNIQRRHEATWPVLERLYLSGVGRVSLAGLATLL